MTKTDPKIGNRVLMPYQSDITLISFKRHMSIMSAYEYQDDRFMELCCFRAKTEVIDYFVTLRSESSYEDV